MTSNRRPSPKQMIRALKSARFHIHRRQETFLCFALTHAKNSNRDLRLAVDYLKDYIGESLGKYSYLDEWQDARRANTAILKEYSERKSCYLPNRIRRQARIDWINWMIDGLEREIQNG